MADMPNDFWAGWIATLTIVSLLGLVWLVISIYFNANKQEQTDSPLWDETLSEGHNPAPMWWFWMTLIALVITVVYLILYPGLGSFSGTLKWSQHGRLDHSMKRYEEKFYPMRKSIAQRPISELQNNEAIMESAQRIFSQNCATCHGKDGTGQANAFPNLKDTVWQWGDSEEAITQTLIHGRRAVMIGWQNVLGDEGVKQVIHYVKTLSNDSDEKNNLEEMNQGKQLFQTNCAACHGLLGEGNQALGAPNLADDTWLYGSSDEALHHTIAIGRNGVMPAFGERLDEVQIRMLTAWLMPENQTDEEVKKEKDSLNKKSDEILASKEIEESVKNDNVSNVVASTSENVGEKIYTQHCASCHQLNGQGLPAVFPSLVGNAVVLNDDPSEHIEVILDGLKDKEIEGVKYTAPMPGFSALLSDEEIAAVVNHERSNWGNEAVMINSENVAAQR